MLVRATMPLLGSTLALLLTGVACAADAPSAPVALASVRAALSALAGEWKGSLTYIDYGNGDEYEIPLATRHELSPDRAALVSWHAYTDPGHIVHTVDVTGVDLDRGLITQAGFRDGKATVVELQVEAFERLADGWRLVLAWDGRDDGRRAAMTRTLVLRGNRFTDRKRVRFEDGGQSFERNRVQLERAE